MKLTLAFNILRQIADAPREARETENYYCKVRAAHRDILVLLSCDLPIKKNINYDLTIVTFGLPAELSIYQQAALDLPNGKFSICRQQISVYRRATFDLPKGIFDLPTTDSDLPTCNFRFTDGQLSIYQSGVFDLPTNIFRFTDGQLSIYQRGYFDLPK